ncbi:hypothetical protein LCGC14_2522190, partial [marine sediment metagenome]
IQTNGTLLDEDWCRFLATEGFAVGLSLDGPPETHDRHRVTKDWKPTHEQLEHFKNFCASIATPEVLAQVLNPANHPKSKAGQYNRRPWMSELYDLRDEIVQGLWRKRWEEEGKLRDEEDAKADKEVRACKYCVMGDVFDLVWLDAPGRWSIELLGACSKCSKGTDLPSKEIIALAKSLGSNCRAVLWELGIQLLVLRLAMSKQVGRGELEHVLRSMTATFKANRTKRKRHQREVQAGSKEEIPF